MKLTGRCEDILRLLGAARWLTTSQVRRRFFARASLDAARKRLRKLHRAGYLTRVRKDRASEALFALGREGARVLERCGSESVAVQRALPKQLEHVVGINDVRIAAEAEASLAYFFACWELPRVGWRHPLVPDAIFGLHGRTFALEFDRGVEAIRFFVRTKVAVYRRGLTGFPLDRVLIVADRQARMESLREAAGDASGLMLFTTIDLIRGRGISAPIFSRYPGCGGLTITEDIFPGSLHGKRGTERDVIETEPLAGAGHQPLKAEGELYAEDDHGR